MLPKYDLGSNLVIFGEILWEEDWRCSYKMSVPSSPLPHTNERERKHTNERERESERERSRARCHRRRHALSIRLKNYGLRYDDLLDPMEDLRHQGGASEAADGDFGRKESEAEEGQGSVHETRVLAQRFAGTSIDQGIAYVLMLVALLLTYLFHPLDAPSPNNLF